MQADVKKFFERYESCFNQGLRGDMDLDEVAALYASEFIAATPAGVVAGKNDDRLKDVMAQGYARYRALGTRSMRIRDARISILNDILSSANAHRQSGIEWSGCRAV